MDFAPSYQQSVLYVITQIKIVLTVKNITYKKERTGIVMLKKMSKLFLIMALSVMLVIGLTACGGGGGDDSGDSGSTGTVNMVMGTGGTSGSWYTVGGVMCGAISNSDMINATAQTSAGGVENIRLVSSNERQLGFCMPSLVIYAEEGIESFENDKIDNIRGIAEFMPMQAHFIVRAGSNIDSIDDLKGKAIGTGAAGSGDEVMCREILKAVGLTYDDVDEQLLSFAEQVTAFKDNQLDAMFMLASAPTSAVLDAASQADCKLLSIEGDLQKKILDEYKYYYETTIPADAYDFIDKDVTTIGINTLLFTNAEMADDAIYELCDQMFNETNMKAIQESHVAMKDFSPETATKTVVKLHPGAEKWYKDNGYL